jgi:hypothetical protein
MARRTERSSSHARDVSMKDTASAGRTITANVAASAWGRNVVVELRRCGIAIRFG